SETPSDPTLSFLLFYVKKGCRNPQKNPAACGLSGLQQLINAYQFNTEYKNLRSHSKFFHRREGRGNTNIAVFGILSVGIGGSGPCHHQAGLLCLCHNGFGTALHGVKGNEISSLGVSPASDLQTAQFALQHLLHLFKLGTQDVSMLTHMV